MIWTGFELDDVYQIIGWTSFGDSGRARIRPSDKESNRIKWSSSSVRWEKRRW